MTTSSPKASSLKPYGTLDLWRGVAALWVVLFHTSATITGRFPDLRQTLLYEFNSLGYLGVQIFFVISGYCIASSACSNLRRGDTWAAFAYARVRRVYPPCWASLALIASFSLLAQFLVASGRLHSSALAGRDLLHQSALYYLSNLTLTQMEFGQPYLSIVCWTLSYEVAFYLIISVFLIKGIRARSEAVLLTGLHGVTLASLALLALAPAHRIFPFDLWPQFGLGVLVFDVLKHPSQIRPKAWLLAVGAALVAFVLTRELRMGPLAEPSRLTFSVALGFALLVLALHRFDAALGQIRAVRALIAVGLFSYSLYLTHFLTLGLVNQVFKLVNLGPSLHWLLLLTCVAAALLAARAFYQFFERPFLHTAKKPVPPVPAVALPVTESKLT